METDQSVVVSGSAVIGARALLSSLLDAGIELCVMNPGTSEMHFVQSLDAVPGMRAVLTLFEGVATGVADGYGRVAGRPAAVVLHLGPGLGNGLANLHNARRARTPMVCVVGAHATDHVRYDAPLQSDIEAVARTVSGWVHTCGSAREIAQDAVRAVEASGRDGGQIATLIVPADVSWSRGARTAPARPRSLPAPVDHRVYAAVGELLGSTSRRMLLLGGRALTERGLRAAGRIAASTGAELLAETFPARMEGGAGVPYVPRLGYLAEQADGQLAGVEELVLARARCPVTFFAYPGRSGDLVPADCRVTELADPGQDVEQALEGLAESLAPRTTPILAQAAIPVLGDEELSVFNLADPVAATLPENAIVVDEANTSGIMFPQVLSGAPRHGLLTLTGGAIGQGLPVATGAALAAPERPVLCVEADGSALYTVQALWTQAREKLDVTTVLFNNAAYAILRLELSRTGAGTAGPRAARMLDLSDPVPDFVALSHGLGVPATRATTVRQLAEALRHAYREPGPHLIEAVVPPIV